MSEAQGGNPDALVIAICAASRSIRSRSIARSLQILDKAKRKDCVAIIQAVAGLAKQMQMTTVAAGVETLAQLNTVTSAGCEEVQGFYLSKPVPAGEVKAVLAECRALLCVDKKQVGS